MGIITWPIFGLIVGALARYFLPGPDSMGLFATLALGVAGSFVGGFLASLIFTGTNVGLQPSGWIGSIAGAMIVLLIVRHLRKQEAA